MQATAAAALVWAALLAGMPAQVADIDKAIAAAEALGARTGVAVADASGRVLYRHRSSEAFAPASNMKVLTAAAVVKGLGPDFRFTTRFRLRQGRLLVEASGDPNWRTGTPHEAGVIFAEVAGALRRLGVDRLAGVDLDARGFQGPSRPATWPQDQLQTYYCAPTGPFVLEQGTFHLQLASGSGASASVTLVAPAIDLPIRGSIELVDGKKNAVYGALDLGDAVQVRGKFPKRGTAVTIKTAVQEPADWYRRALLQALAQAGIAAEGGPVGGDDRLVHEHQSDLGQALLRMLEDSSNFDAEQCLRVLGHEQLQDGSLAGGTQALTKYVASFAGEVPADVVLADGSGLSKQNRLTPGLLVVALARAGDGRAGELLRTCLPVSGQSGTLSDRFVGTDLVGRVQAKTGWIRGASALSGFVTGRTGKQRLFAILMNYDPKKDGLNKELKRLQERIVAGIDALEPQR